MLVGEVEVGFPIERGHVVFAGPDVVADGAVGRLVDGRLVICGERPCLEQFVHGRGMLCGEEFPLRIGPAILHCTGDVEGAWRHQCGDGREH